MNHRALIALFVLIVLSTTNLTQQTVLALVDPTPTLASPSIVWQRTFSQGTLTSISSVTQTSDGGYALAGTVMSITLGEIEYWVTKTDSLGNQQWSINGLHFDGNSGYGPASSIVQTADGGYAFVGGYGSFYVPSYLIKTGSEGEIQYNQSYGSFSFSSLKMSGDGFVMAGYQNKNLTLAKADSNGSIEWNHTYGEFGFVSMVPTSDGGYALAGSAWNGSESYTVLVKTDSLGNMLWSQKYSGNSGNLQARFLTQSRQGGFVLAGLTGKSDTSLACLIETDEQGNVLWNQTYGDLGSVARSIVSTIDGGYAFVSGWDSVDYSNLVKVDLRGNLHWSIPFGSRVDVVLQTGDGAYTLAGSRGSGVWLSTTTVDTAAPLPTATSTTSHQSLSPTLTPSPSIPEFPSWITMAIMVVAVATSALIYRCRLRKQK